MFDPEENPIAPLFPSTFFQISVDCKHLPTGQFPRINDSNMRHYLLPETTHLLNEEQGATVCIGWNEEGVELYVIFSEWTTMQTHSDLRKGASVEVFIDTRDVKTSGFNTRFCHHFFFLPEKTEGRSAGEITHFRTEDRHDLCDPKNLMTSVSKNFLRGLHIFIPSLCLFGYDPHDFDRLGFNYRINFPEHNPQHFIVSSKEYQIEQQPSLWGRLRLVK